MAGQNVARQPPRRWLLVNVAIRLPLCRRAAIRREDGSLPAQEKDECRTRSFPAMG
jgi:hypothetical protein